MKALRIIIYIIASITIAEWCWFFGYALYLDLQEGTPMYNGIIPLVLCPMPIISVLAIVFCVVERSREKRWW